MTAKLRPFADLLLGLAVVLVVDVVAFHQGFYFGWLRPDSYAGRVEQSSRRFAALRAGNPLRQVVVLSNSTGNACIDEAELQGSLQGAGWPLAAINLSEGGSSARSWYHLLRHEAVTRATTAVVVLGVHPMSLEAGDVKPDLEILKTRLGLVDLATLPWSYEKTERRLQVATAVAFRTPLFGEDLRDFLAAPRERLAAVAAAARNPDNLKLGWRTARSRATLESARLDAAGNLDLAALDPRLRRDPKLVRQLTNTLRRRAAAVATPAPPMVIEGQQAAMLKAAVRLLDRRGVAVVVAVTPFSPYPAPGPSIAPLAELVAELRQEGARVTLFHDQAMLTAIEGPTYFRDLLHVNVAGAEIYTRSLAAFLANGFASAAIPIVEKPGPPRPMPARPLPPPADGEAAPEPEA